MQSRSAHGIHRPYTYLIYVGDPLINSGTSSTIAPPEPLPGQVPDKLGDMATTPDLCKANVL